jgi:hypothetical protein
MKISEKTINYLKNFSTINQSILMRDGTKLSTVSPQKNIMAVANIEESIPSRVAIYDLPRFIGTISLFDDPEYSFEDDHVLLSGGQQATKYKFADEQSIVAAPDKEIVLEDPEVEFFVQVEDLTNVIKACNVLRLPEIGIVGDGETVSIQALDISNQDSDNHRVNVGKTDLYFRMIFKPENLKLMSRNYNVRVSSKGIVEFSSDDLKYWIATEAASKFGE